MRRYFPVPVDTAILICNGSESIVNISDQIIDNRGNDYRIGVNTAQYKHFYVLPSDDTFLSRFEDLYTDHTAMLNRLIDQNEIETSDRDDEGRYRFKIGTGFYRDDPVWLCPGNIDMVTLKLFISHAERNGKKNFIFCQERDTAALREIVKNTSIRVGAIREA